jgi:uncharacterized protein
MQAIDRNSPAQPPRMSLVWFGVVFAIVFPSIVTWAYFFQAADAAEGTQRTVMAVMKGLQFAFPLVWAIVVLRERPRLCGPRKDGLALGLAFGLLVTIVGWLLYAFVLRDTSGFAAATAPAREKIADFGLDSAAKFIALGAFYSAIHSLLEEYYWRWFVFGQLRILLSARSAIVVSALGFTAHHVLVLSNYFGWWTLPTLLLSAAVAIGGAFWAWL